MDTKKEFQDEFFKMGRLWYFIKLISNLIPNGVISDIPDKCGCWFLT